MTTAVERRINLAIEKVERLTGERAAGDKRALLRSDFAAVRRILVPDITAADAAGATPTAAEHNALVADVAAIRRVLVAILSAL
jgi:hypothetical protein